MVYRTMSPLRLVVYSRALNMLGRGPRITVLISVNFSPCGVQLSSLRLGGIINSPLVPARAEPLPSFGLSCPTTTTVSLIARGINYILCLPRDYLLNLSRLT